MSKIYLSKFAYPEVISYLKSKGHDVILLEPNDAVYPAISCHSDIFMCQLGNSDGKDVFYGDPARLTPSYPGDIIYNAACTGKYFIHRLDQTDPKLLQEAKSLGMELINVKQGYTKCNICIVNEETIITSDKGIAKSLEDYDIKVLLIRPGHILLPGLDQGFIGGTSGAVDDEIIFNGDLESHPDFKLIKETIESAGKACIYFKGKPLLDIGSITLDRSKE